MLGTQGYLTLRYLHLNNKVMFFFFTIATQFLGGYLFLFCLKLVKLNNSVDQLLESLNWSKFEKQKISKWN